jgi:hypothetical protein
MMAKVRDWSEPCPRCETPARGGERGFNCKSCGHVWGVPDGRPRDGGRVVQENVDYHGLREDYEAGACHDDRPLDRVFR